MSKVSVFRSGDTAVMIRLYDSKWFWEEEAITIVYPTFQST